MPDQPTILLADPDTVRRSRIARRLRPAARVLETANGAQAAALADAHRPSVTLAATVLPGLGGIELLAHLRWQCAARPSAGVPAVDAPAVALLVERGTAPGDRAGSWSVACLAADQSPAAVAECVLAIAAERRAA